MTSVQAITLYHTYKGLVNFIINMFQTPNSLFLMCCYSPLFSCFELYFPCVFFMCFIDVIQSTERQYSPVTFQRLHACFGFLQQAPDGLKNLKSSKGNEAQKGLCAPRELPRFDRTHGPEHQMSAAPIIMRQNIIVFVGGGQFQRVQLSVISTSHKQK